MLFILELPKIAFLPFALFRSCTANNRYECLFLSSLCGVHRFVIKSVAPFQALTYYFFTVPISLSLSLPPPSRCCFALFSLSLFPAFFILSLFISLLISLMLVHFSISLSLFSLSLCLFLPLSSFSNLSLSLCLCVSLSLSVLSVMVALMLIGMRPWHSCS